MYHVYIAEYKASFFPSLPPPLSRFILHWWISFGTPRRLSSAVLHKEASEALYSAFIHTDFGVSEDAARLVEVGFML